MPFRIITTRARVNSMAGFYRNIDIKNLFGCHEASYNMAPESDPVCGIVLLHGPNQNIMDLDQNIFHRLRHEKILRISSFRRRVVY